MSRRRGVARWLLLLWAAAMLASAVEGLRDLDTIDTFETTSPSMSGVVESDEQLPLVLQQLTTAKKGIEGGERDLLFNITDAPLGSPFDTGVYGGNWAVEFPPHAEGTILLQYDGEDQTAYLDPHGLGGVDLERKGADCIHMRISSEGELSYRVVVHDMDGNAAESTFAVEQSFATDAILYYDEFTLHQEVELNWELVGAIEIFAIAPTESDSMVRSTVFKLSTADSTIDPSPASPLSSANISPNAESPDHEHKEGDSLPASVLITAFGSLLGTMGLLAILGILAVALLLIYERISKRR